MHPGILGEYAVVRWTAPSSVGVRVSGFFDGIDQSQPTTTNVYVLLDGLSVFSGDIVGNTAPFDLTLAVLSGHTIDFAVGFGSDGNYFYDSTGLSATINAVPEPGTFVLAVPGLAALVCTFRRRQYRTAKAKRRHKTAPVPVDVNEVFKESLYSRHKLAGH